MTYGMIIYSQYLPILVHKDIFKRSFWGLSDGGMARVLRISDLEPATIFLFYCTMIWSTRPIINKLLLLSRIKIEDPSSCTKSIIFERGANFSGIGENEILWNTWKPWFRDIPGRLTFENWVNPDDEGAFPEELLAKPATCGRFLLLIWHIQSFSFNFVWRIQWTVNSKPGYFLSL